MLAMELVWLRRTIRINRVLNDFNADELDAILSVMRAGIQ